MFTSALTLFVSGGFGQLLVQRRTIDRTYLDSAFWFSLVAGASLAGLLYGLAPLLAAGLKEPGLVGVLRGLTPVFVLTGLASVPGALLAREVRLTVIANITLASALVSAAVGLVMAFNGGGVNSLVVQTVTDALVTTVLMWGAVTYRPGTSVRWTSLRELVAFGSKITAANFLNLLSVRADDFLIGVFLGPSALGYYTIAYKLLLQLQEVILGLARSVTFPVFSRLQDDRTALRAAWFRAHRLEVAAVLPVFAAAAVLSAGRNAAHAGVTTAHRRTHASLRSRVRARAVSGREGR